MKNGWTGGQYSLYRAILGLVLLIRFARLLPSLPAIAGCIAAMAFAAGILDRIAAVLLCSILAWTLGWGALLFWMLPLHAVLPPAPYGSWASRGRVDPRGRWRMPEPLFAAAWMATSLEYAYLGYSHAGTPGVLELLYAPLAISRRARPWIWTAMLVVNVVTLSFDLVLMHLFTFDPSWVPRSAPERKERVFYDGTCGLCHRGVRFLLSEDARGEAFTFTPLQSAVFDDPTLPDSVIVQTEEGRLLTRSDATIYVLRRLGGGWRLLAGLFAAVPRRLRDAAYDGVARIRYRLFERPQEACPVLPADLRSRFVL